MAEQVTIPDVLKKLAARHGWPEDLVAEALGKGVTVEQVASAMNALVTPDQFRQRLEQGGPSTPPPDLRWMNVPTERLPKIIPSEQGLLLSQVEVGSYGYAPDHWTYTNDMPRGAYPGRLPGLAALYTIYDKAEVWSENVRDLYEDAILNRWKSATDAPWDQLRELPAHVEMAICQISTRISEESLVAGGVLASWFEKISYGYHDVKLYLSTTTFETARHAEAFRKRALANGGGLGVQGVGHYNRTVGGAMRFTEFVIYEFLLRASFRRTMLSVLEEHAPTETDRWLFRMTGQDLDRWLAYALGHLEFHVQYDPDNRRQVAVWLARGELFLAADLERDTPVNEALMLLLGGDESAAAGRAALQALRRRQVEEYRERLAGATVPRKWEDLAKGMQTLAEPEMVAT